MLLTFTWDGGMDQHGARGLSRRRFLLGALAAGGGVALGGCGRPLIGAAGAGGIAYWDLFGGGDGARMQSMIQSFRDENPGTPVEAVTLAWGAPYYTKLAMSAAGGRAPDVAISHVSRLAAYAPTGLLDPFDPDLLAEYDLTAEQFPEGVWERCQFDGQTFALPLDTHPYVLYYNTEHCGEAGLLDDDGRLKPLQGPDALVEAFAAGQEFTDWGVVWETTNPWRLWFSLYRQLGGEVIEGEELVLDRELGIQALQFMQRLSIEEEVSPTSLDYVALVAEFLSGNAAFMLNGEWEAGTMLDAGLPFDMAPFPDVYGNSRCQADSHALVLPHQRNATDEQRRASMDFIKSLMTNSLEWARGGHVPSYQPVATSEAYQQLEPQSHYAEAADNVQLGPQAWFAGSGSQLEAEAGGAFSVVVNGQLSPEAALDQFGAAIERLLALPGPQAEQA